MDRSRIERGLLALFAASLCGAAYAQRIVAKENVARMAVQLEPHASDKLLDCEVQSIHPALNFGFRFQAGYFFGVRLSDYAGHRWTALTRVTPEESDSQDYYLIASGRYPPAPKETRLRAQAGGSFWVGEGRYRVKWMLRDDRGRVCRKEWRMDARLGHYDHKIKPTIPPNTVAELSWKGFSNQEQATDIAPIPKLTVLLDAAPRRVRRNSPANLNFADQLQLVGAMAELLHDVPSDSVRLVAFSLDQQREVFRRDEFRMEEDVDQLAEALNSLRLGQVDQAILRNPGGRVTLLSGIINREISDPDPAGMVILLGPEERYEDKIPMEAITRPPASGPRFFYVECKPAPIIPMFQEFDLSRGGNFNKPSEFLVQPSGFGSQSNLIQSAVKRLQGESFMVYTPGQFAKAVERIQREAIQK